MKALLSIGVLCSFLLASANANAEEAAQKGDFVIGAQLGMGFEWGARNPELKDDMDDAGSIFGLTLGEVTSSAGFSAGGWFLADYYVLDLLALEAGFGFLEKGAHYKSEIHTVVGTINGDLWLKMAYMEIPLGVKFNIHNFRISSLLLLNIALSGRTKVKNDDNTSEHHFNDDDWDDWQRFNLGLRFGVGYAIPVGPIVIVPGIDWSFHFIDEIKNDDVFEDEEVRWMNFFFNVAVEFPIPH
jgi:hypothetical protein